MLYIWIKQSLLIMEILQKAWLGIVRRQTELYSQCISLSSTYIRYDPFVGTRSMKEQLLDEIPSEHVEAAMDAREGVRRACGSFFQECQKVSRLIPSLPVETVCRCFEKKLEASVEGSTFVSMLTQCILQGSHRIPPGIFLPWLVSVGVE